MPETKLITLDPGHFHAALIQKQMYPDVARRASVFAPLGPDLVAHLDRVARFNARPENPTSWELDVHSRPDFLAAMRDSPPGNVVVLSHADNRQLTARDVWGPPGDAATVIRAIKDRFDPQGILNPGRLDYGS